MKKIETSISGLYILETVDFQDERGCFQKLYNYDFLRKTIWILILKSFIILFPGKMSSGGCIFSCPLSIIRN